MAKKRTTRRNKKATGKGGRIMSPKSKIQGIESAIERLISQSRHRDALERIDKLANEESLTLRLRQLRGLALARLGHLRDAQLELGALVEEGHRDPETLGIYARTWMDRYDKSCDKKHLKRSRDLYAESFELSPKDSYTGINAAAKSVMLGDKKAADEYARKVAKILGPKPNRHDYWDCATMAEVHLIQNDYEQAGKFYRDAVVCCPDDVASHETTRLQAERLMEAKKTTRAQRAVVRLAFKGDLTRSIDAAPGEALSTPPYRRLRVFAFDPSLSTRIETAAINEITLHVPWESDPGEISGATKGSDSVTGSILPGESSLKPGPVGEYLEVVDYDPSSECFYEAVDLDDQRLLATDGCAPSEGDPRFHQQMVYAVSMNVITHFERALGRRALWAARNDEDDMDADLDDEERYVRRLRIYPHALREANAYYSPQKRALLFGYFPAQVDDPEILPGGMVFTCLSHDVIAHEMSHALLDGLHRHFAESSNPDVLAFHEAFADVVALFQHFSHPEVLEFEIARTGGNLESQSLLGQLAQQFGRSIGRYGALRDAIGEIDPDTNEWRPQIPDPTALQTATEPHARGAILVAAIFDAFLAIYKSRVGDLFRIASEGRGILPPGALHPDLVRRLAEEAAKTAKHMLHICIRALDYCPPVDIEFGDYLRAMITADIDMVPDDRRNYRLAIIEAFQRRGIYPRDVRTLSVESLVWRPPRVPNIDLRPLFKGTVRVKGNKLEPEWHPTSKRKELYLRMRLNAAIVDSWLNEYCRPAEAKELGLDFTADAPRSIYRDRGTPEVKVHSVRLAQRTGADGSRVADFVIEILQRRRGYFDTNRQEAVDKARRSPNRTDRGDFTFRGGCTLLVDPETCMVRYAVTKNILSEVRLARQRAFLSGRDDRLRATYFGNPLQQDAVGEPFAMLHRSTDEGVD
jgi:tetratricopeptide (TPR) repeat protein